MPSLCGEELNIILCKKNSFDFRYVLKFLIVKHKICLLINK